MSGKENPNPLIQYQAHIEHLERVEEARERIIQKTKNGNLRINKEAMAIYLKLIGDDEKDKK